MLNPRITLAGVLWTVGIGAALSLACWSLWVGPAFVAIMAAAHGIDVLDERARRRAWPCNPQPIGHAARIKPALDSQADNLEALLRRARERDDPIRQGPTEDLVRWCCLCGADNQGPRSWGAGPVCPDCEDKAKG